MHRESIMYQRVIRRGAVDVKTIVALVFALAGLSWATMSLLGGRSDPDPSGPRVIASALDDEGNAIDADYTSTKGERRLGEASEQIEDIVAAQSLKALSEITGPKGAPEGVSEAVVNSFIPLVSGDHDAFLAAIEAMGGQIAGDLDGEHPIFTHLKKEFEDAKIDLDRISVQKYVPQDRRTMGTRQTRDVDEEEADDGFEMQTNRMEMRPASIFPDAPATTDPSAIEVSIPVQPKGEELESIFSLILTWNSDAKLWQPATYGIVKNRLVERDG